MKPFFLKHQNLENWGACDSVKQNLVVSTSRTVILVRGQQGTGIGQLGIGASRQSTWGYDSMEGGEFSSETKDCSYRGSRVIQKRSAEASILKSKC